MELVNGGRVAWSLNRILGIPQEEIARDLGVSHASVSAWTTGRSHPRSSNAKLLRKMLDRECLKAHADGKTLLATLAKLEVTYGSPRQGNHDNPLDELFFRLLSLKASVRTYEAVYDAFAAAYRPWKKLLDARSEDVESCIQKDGLGSIKARSFIDIVNRLKEDFGTVSLNQLKKWSTKIAEE
jgi:transcriptional regulator with XRE-family HTH domain